MQVPIFSTLYFLKENGKIYEWSISIENNDTNLETYKILTFHGEKEGKKVKHSRDITEGKGKKTALEQAIQEAKKKWDNKKEKELYVEHIDINSTSGKAIPEKIITVRPMLANTFSFNLYDSSKKSRAFKIEFPAYVQRKYDGIRCIAYIKEGNVIIESRKGISFQNFIILKEELKTLFSNLSPDFYFDGELYTNELDFETTSGLIRLSEKKCTPEDTIKINKIEYHIYDFFDINNPQMIYKDRLDFLNTFLSKHCKKCNLCKQVETIEIENIENVKTYHDNFVQEGYEGIMIRDKNGLYEVNKRSKYLQKFKEFMEEEFKIINFHEGSGDEKGAIIWDCETKDKTPFAVRPKGTFESRKKLFNEGSKYIGKLLTVIFQEYSADGVPRFPVGKAIRDIY
jgi:ATP-dependent DNA ligase